MKSVHDEHISIGSSDGESEEGESSSEYQDDGSEYQDDGEQDAESEYLSSSEESEKSEKSRKPKQSKEGGKTIELSKKFFKTAQKKKSDKYKKWNKAYPKSGFKRMELGPELIEKLQVENMWHPTLLSGSVYSQIYTNVVEDGYLISLNDEQCAALTKQITDTAKKLRQDLFDRNKTFGKQDKAAINLAIRVLETEFPFLQISASNVQTEDIMWHALEYARETDRKKKKLAKMARKEEKAKKATARKIKRNSKE